jgi:hypothetical protein
VAALVAAAVLGLAGSAASAGVISSRVRAYNSDSVRVLAGRPVLVTLSAGRYGAFGGCADEWGCAQLGPRDLSVEGAISGAVGTVPYSRLEQRTDAGQPFNQDLTFTVPVREAVRIALNVNPRQPVLVAPSPDKAGLIHNEVAAMIGCAVLLGVSLATLAWLLVARTRRSGITGVQEDDLFRSHRPSLTSCAVRVAGCPQLHTIMVISTPGRGARRPGLRAGWTAARGASRCSRRGRRP